MRAATVFSRFLLPVVATLCLGAVSASAATTAITLEINKGKLLKLDRAAASVIIADPLIADVQVVSPSLIYVNGKRTGETSVFAVDATDGEILNATITVTHNLSKLNSAVKRLAPESDVKFSTVDGALVMNGNASSPIAADEISRIATPFLQANETLLNMIQTAGADQVTLKVKVAEVSRAELKRFGINWESVLNSGNFIFGLGQGRDVVDAAGSLIRSPAGDNQINVGYQGGNYNLNTVIDALANDGLVTVLAEPNLTTQSGKTASFLAGGEFPIPVPQANGNGGNVITIEYRPYGVSLAFTPQVLAKDRISLTVSPEVSTLSQSGSVQLDNFTIPALTTRRAQTTVELGSGQTFAIAGLLQNNSGNDISKFPALGDLPIIGALFRSSAFRQAETELVILVTPYIVSPVKESQIKLPTDGFIPASDAERIFMGKLYHEHGPEKPSTASNGATLNGPMGYVLK